MTTWRDPEAPAAPPSAGPVARADRPLAIAAPPRAATVDPVDPVVGSSRSRAASRCRRGRPSRPTTPVTGAGAGAPPLTRADSAAGPGPTAAPGAPPPGAGVGGAAPAAGFRWSRGRRVSPTARCRPTTPAPAGAGVMRRPVVAARELAIPPGRAVRAVPAAPPPVGREAPAA